MGFQQEKKETKANKVKGMYFYVLSRGALFSLGAMAALTIKELFIKGVSLSVVTNSHFLLELGLALLASFPFACYGALRKWRIDQEKNGFK